MLQSFFTGLSGMFSFSKSLDTVSNNISNMNTPGYRGTDTFYNSLTGGDAGGLGTQISGLGYRFTTGDIRQTGNATDIALNGNGFFTLMSEGQHLYTRAGQFAFSADGVLIDKNSGLNVAAVDESGALTDFDISDLRTLQPQATSKVTLAGNLSSASDEHTISNISIYNELGELEVVSLKFEKDSSEQGTWKVTILDENNASLSEKTIKFDVTGTPATNFNSFSFEFTSSQGGKSNVTFEFGENGSFSGATSTDTGSTSTIRATVTDGYAASELQSVSFQQDGSIELKYSNGETKSGPQLAIASVKELDKLENLQGSIFAAPSNVSVEYLTAGSGDVGSIATESVELSNVDLSREFADMIVIQRGYQASSRVLNVSNQMLDQLFENTRGR